ncbi:MAG: hypothetical protein NZS48_10420, partial [Gemmata sp.]|nr:hypothetical protein [Gemmata sp.]
MDVTGNATTTWYCYGMYAGYSYSFESVASERTVTGLETVMRVTAATAVETVGSWDAFTGTSGSVGTSGLLTRSGTNEVR